MSGIFKKFKSDDIQVTPYEANKSYLIYFNDKTGSYYEKNYEQSVIKDHTYTSSNAMWIGTVSLSAYAYDAEYDGTEFRGDEIGRYSQVTTPSLHTRTTNNFYKRSMFDSIEKMYYTNPDDVGWTLHNTDQSKEMRNLEHKAQILSIPQRMFGDAIEKTTLHISASGISIKDDGYGNLYDSGVVQYDMRPSRLFYLNFSGLHKQTGLKFSANTIKALNKTTPRKRKAKDVFKKPIHFVEKSRFDNFVEAHNIRPQTHSTEGTVVKFSGIEYKSTENTTAATESRQDIKNIETFRVKHTPQYDWREKDDWSIYLRVSASAEQPGTGSNWTDPVHGVIADDVTYVLSKTDDRHTPKYPFTITYHASANMYLCTMNDGTSITVVAKVPTATGYNDIIVVKSGSTLNMYMDTQAVNTNTIPSGPTSNKGDIMIGTRQAFRGGYKLTSKARYNTRKKPAVEYVRNFAGDISDVQIFDKALSLGERNFLTGTSTSGIVGNVFYKHGLAVITDLANKYDDCLSECTLSFNNTHTIFENEYACHIKEREFLYTMNPSIIDDTKFSTIKHFVSQSSFSPYITTIGLYDNHARLLAIGKLSSPIKKSADYDTSFIVKFDS